MKSNNVWKLTLVSFSLLIILACNALFPPPPVSPSPIPPAMTVASGSGQAVISRLSYDEASENPKYKISGQIPGMLDNSDPRTSAFNDVIHALFDGEVAAFKRNISELPSDPNSGASSFDAKYSVLFQNDGMASIKFDFSEYASGAAHPGHHSRTVNYDFEQARPLVLDELFLPGSNYLEVISNYCIAELKKQPYSDSVFLDGAEPTPDNYRNWNITLDGLMITFDEYQVAPYAAGPQTITVPYDELRAVIDPQGPLGKINR